MFLFLRQTRGLEEAGIGFRKGDLFRGVYALCRTRSYDNTKKKEKKKVEGGVVIQLL